MKVCEKEGNYSTTLSPSDELQNATRKAIIANGNNLARFSATNDVQAKDCRHLDSYTAKRGRVSAAVKAAMLLQRDCALAAMGRQLRYENSTTILQRGAGNTVRVCAFFVWSVRATSVQVYNRRTTATRPRRGRTPAVQSGYHRTSAMRRGSMATELRGTPKSATSLRRGGTTTRPVHCRAAGAQLFNRSRSARSLVRGGATAAHLYPFNRGAASTGPLRDCTSLTQLCGRGATATRSQSTERSVTASKLHCCTTEGLLHSTTTTRGGVAAVKLCDCGAAAARPQRRNAVANQTGDTAPCGGDAARRCGDDAAW
jgi:hypothetical protein